ncbi:TPA: hypothetical protein EYP37_01890 [Candidatus Poribacteria bacterium]|nr:hypothetical protein [Candidatus Poribacteria bacterium]
MRDEEKLLVLIPHWIEHNGEHAAEFRRWAARAGIGEADLLKAAEAMERANDHLRAALEKLKGPPKP